MKTIFRTCIIGFCGIALLAFIEVSIGLGRQAYYERTLRSQVKKVEIGMQKEIVISLLGPPNSSIQNELGETLYWDGAAKQSWLLNVSGINTLKGRFEIAGNFNEEVLSKIWIEGEP